MGGQVARFEVCCCGVVAGRLQHRQLAEASGRQANRWRPLAELVRKDGSRLFRAERVDG